MDAFFPYTADTSGVIVRVSVNYLPEQSEPKKDHWFWAYHVRIENETGATVKLLTRHWSIRDARGMLHEVDGDGVVGEQPVLAPGESFNYVSGCPLSTSSGSMQGHYTMVNESGERFQVEIPLFLLKDPVATA